MYGNFFIKYTFQGACFVSGVGVSRGVKGGMEGCVGNKYKVKD